MSARKAYISSLGTTGLLVAAALSMLIVVGALVAFDRWPNQAVAEAEAVPIASDGSDAIRRAAEPRELGAALPIARTSVLSASRVDAVLRKSAARAGRIDSQTSRAAARATSTPTVSDPIVSDLPAPDSTSAAPAPAQAAPAPAAQAPAPSPAPAILPPGTVTPNAGDSLDGVSGSVADTVGGLNPGLGQTVRGTASTTSATLDGLLGQS